MGQAHHTKVAPVESEDRIDSFTICQVQQRCVGKLNLKISVLGENRGNGGQIRFAEREDLKRPAVKRRQQPSHRVGICAQEPSRLCDYWPTSKQRRSNLPELLDARFVVLVGLDQHRYDRTRIDEHSAAQDPNPSKCFGFVLRSRTFAFTMPISPAFFR